MAKHALTDAEHEPAVPPDERGERGLIAIARESGDEFGIAGLGEVLRAERPPHVLECRGKRSRRAHVEPQGPAVRKLLPGGGGIPSRISAKWFALAPGRS
jgi:hypothetical protein